MKVKELIEYLKKQNPESDIVISIDMNDGNAQSAIPDYVYVNKFGEVVIEFCCC